MAIAVLKIIRNVTIAIAKPNHGWMWLTSASIGMSWSYTVVICVSNAPATSVSSTP